MIFLDKLRGVIIKIKEIFFNVLNIVLELFKALLLAAFLVLAFVPIIEKSEIFKSILQFKDERMLIGISCLLLFLCIITWKRLNNYWRKYKNTYSDNKTKFTYIDFIFSLLFFFVWISINIIDKNLNPSFEIIVFFTFVNALILIYLISSFYWPHKKLLLRSLSRVKRSDVSDEPIKYLDEDLLNRQMFVGGLLEEIKELNIPESFVFGLDGKWGDGKTSVLNLLKTLLQYDKRFIVMSFEPWNFKDEEAILKAFFNTLEKSLNEDYDFPHLRRLLYKYQKLISSGLENVGFKIDFGFEQETIDEIKEKIENYIESTGKKLIVIIDEIDRLEADEIRMIFKVVRSNSKFKNSIFILSLDKDKTVEKLDTTSVSLEKIIQKPISLPKIEHNFIDKFVLFSDHKIPQYTLEELKELKSDILVSTFGFVSDIKDGMLEIINSLENNGDTKYVIRYKSNDGLKFKIGDKVFVEGILRKDEIRLSDPNSRLVPFKLSRIDQLLERMWREKKITLQQIENFDKDFVILYKKHIRYFFQNFRDAKLFLNSLYSSYPAIAMEVDPHDFISLEVVKVFAKDIYDDIFENWWYYVNQRLEGDYLNSPFALLLSNEKEKAKEETLKHIEDIIKKSKIEDSQKRAIRAIIFNIFKNISNRESASNEDRINKKIQSTSFLKYFTLNVPSTELSDAFFEDELKFWKVHPSFNTLRGTFMKLQKQGKLVEFLDKLRLIYLERFPKRIVTVMLSTISRDINKFSRRDLGDLWDSEYDRALMLVLRTLNLKIDKSKIDGEIKKLIQKTPSMLFAVDLLLTTKKERNGDIYNVYENVNHPLLRKKLSARLKRHFITGKRDVFKEYAEKKGWARILYQWSSNWSDNSSPNKVMVADYIVSVTKNNVNNLIELLKTFNTGSFDFEEWGMNYEEYSRVYDLTKLVEVAKQHLKLVDLDPEHRKILKKFVSIVEEKSNNKELV